MKQQQHIDYSKGVCWFVINYGTSSSWFMVKANEIPKEEAYRFLGRNGFSFLATRIVSTFIVDEHKEILEEFDLDFI